MKKLSQKTLQTYRNRTYRIDANRKVYSPDQAVAFVQERGFVYFWPIKGITFPSLWTAVAGNRRVADAHDDPGHVTWGWKDNSLGKRIWYYGKILRKKATIIDLAVAPYFYALSENYGNPVEDALIQYHDGHLSSEAKAIFETLVEQGPLDTVSIRQITRMNSKEKNYRFEKALSLLQSDFKILPVGVSNAGAWHYAFIYDLTHRHHPEMPEQARFIREHEARLKLLELYFLSVGAAQFRDVMKLFQWKRKHAEQAVQSLVGSGFLVDHCVLESESGDWYVIKDLV